ncbi:MAG: DUF5752 family protein [Candidatus Bathyarchaeaceae archaeon]
MRNVKKKTKRRIGSELGSRILRTVPIPEAFLFFTDIGQYTGEFAPSLSDFCEKLKTTPLKSIEFHFKRRDFERWVRETLGDEYLANRISKIDRSAQGEELRKTIQGIVKNRLNQLKVVSIT